MESWRRKGNGEGLLTGFHGISFGGFCALCSVNYMGIYRHKEAENWREKKFGKRERKREEEVGRKMRETE